MAYQIFQEHALPVECLLGFAVQPFSSTGNIERDLLSITSVHPMREVEVRNLLKKTGEDWQLIENLIREKKLIQTVYGDQKFYVRNFSNVKKK